MRTTEADRAFLRLISPGRAAKLESVLAERREWLDVMGRGDRPRAIRADIRDLAAVCWQLWRARRRASEASAADFVLFDRDDAALPGRVSFARRFAADLVPYPVGLRTPWARQPDWRWTRAAMLGCFRLALSPRARASVLSRSYVAIVKQCLLIAPHAFASGERVAYLFRPYRVEVPFLAARLMDLGIDVQLVANTTPLWPNTTRMIGTGLVLCHPYQVDEARVLNAEGLIPSTRLWGPQETVELEEFYSARPMSVHERIVGVYTQGYWLRRRLGTAPGEEARLEDEHERAFLALLSEQLGQHPDLELVIFPHPMERRAYEETGEHGYGALPNHPRVSVDWAETNSLRGFDRCGLGVTTFSTIGFDRLWMGCRTLFMTLPEHVDPRVRSPFERVLLTEEHRFLTEMERCRHLSNEEFMNDVFGGPLRDSSAG